MQLLFSTFSDITSELKKLNYELTCLHLVWSCYLKYDNDEVILHTFGIELLIATFGYSAIELRQQSIFQAGKKVILFMDLLFSMFKCPIVELGW